MRLARTPFFLAAGAAAALALSLSRDARALGPVDVEVAVITGGGTTPTGNGSAPLMAGDPAGAPNPIGFGLGGRAGIVFHGIYAGVAGIYYAGASSGSPYYLSVNSDLLGVDVGYGFTLSAVTIRPLLGIGDFTERVNELPEPGGGGPAGSGGVGVLLPSSQSVSYDTLYIQPGITGLVSLDPHWYVGADANGLFLTSLPETFGGSASNGRYSALTFHVQVGARF